MPIHPPKHRPAAQARRTALLEAAIDVIAEKGIDGATHRAIAARAEMPLSTTSYFFASIDELVAEAMRTVATRLIAQVEDLIPDFVRADEDVDESINRFAKMLTAVRPAEVAAEFEIYLQCRQRPELQATAHHMMASFEQAAEAALREMGATRPNEAARVMIALLDGFALHRLAWPRGDADRRVLLSGIRALMRAYLPDDK
ncbi:MULTISPECIES: TetR/AcrR family transcriptional regulator [Paraburkholderia]|uniref:TetR/AcrR family transcriptional regulator n=1 Tax=Paraburkholderia TaxID=1822464 RepID=UPI002250DF59|nr:MULTISPECIES: TetR family transcriptional regulator [Paraburkholderia]MCX4164701.1 TetR family transcriptional regulator [Paraburkholderia megapolitana]MDN7160194.1 TetR family transcriptional regulator [Paraburkholderia sp. CHISQ3]MDQ6497241.1 TetR family transcriptional regulator [Paraburkholderia megapolitana]